MARMVEWQALYKCSTKAIDALAGGASADNFC